jgi:hypothetical protein
MKYMACEIHLNLIKQPCSCVTVFDHTAPARSNNQATTPQVLLTYRDGVLIDSEGFNTVDDGP